MPISEVKRRDGYVVFKVETKKGKLLCFRVFPEHAVGEAQHRREFALLVQADAFIDEGSGRI